MTVSIVDTPNIATPQIVHLQADKIAAVIRYLSPIYPTGLKSIKAAEAHALALAGIRLGLVCEGWGDFQSHGDAFLQISSQAGARDGKFCANYAPAVGAPSGACIFFAVDADANAIQISRYVAPYFASINNAFAAAGGHYLIGAYGSGAVCHALAQAKLITYAWLSQSMGWTGSKEYLAAKPKELVLVQGPEARLANLDVDGDTHEALGEWGDFLPFETSPPVIPVTPLAAAPVRRPVEAEVVAWLEGLLAVA